MSDNDQIKDLFSEKLGNYEAKVNPDLWANVASQVGAASGATGVGGMSLLTKAIIGISGAAVIATGVVLYTSSDSDNTVKEPKNTAVVSEKSEEDSSKIKEDEKVFVVDNKSNSNTTSQVNQKSIPAVIPNDDVVPTTGPRDGKALSDPDEVIVPADPIEKPKQDSAPSSFNKVDDQIGKEDITEARNNDIIKLEQEHLAKEDDPLQNIVIEDTSTEEKEDISIIIPDVFTPDGNGLNDVYHLILGEDIAFRSFDFVIYDQTGNTVMMSKDPRFRWTGLDPTRGQLVPAGKYVYILVAESEKGTPIKETGTITVRY
ncbi:MAG: gliding motility-associated C-terminal domain-containing protein [bacterium]|nr:gliding motility-associated C-terminal domain-containing protein [bacterium]